MNRKRPVNPEENIWGTSPLGGNSEEGTADGMAVVRDTTEQGVPLFYDDRVTNFISEQAVEELNDRDISLDMQRIFNEEEEFRQKVGYTTDGTRS